MKRKKRTQRLLAMLLTLMLCVGEFASTGFSVFAADDEITDTVSDTVSVDESDEETENVMFSSSEKFIKLGDSIEYGGSSDEAWYPKSGSGGYIDSKGRERSITPTYESGSKKLKSIKLFHNDSNSRDYWVFGAIDFKETDSDNIFNTDKFRNDCLVFEIPKGKTVSDIPKGLYADDIVSWENNGRVHTTYYVVPYYGGKIIALDPGEGTGEMPSVELEDSAESYVLPECSFDAPEGKVFDKWDLGNPGDTIELSEEYTVITALWKYGSDIWIGDTQVTPDNMTSIPCDSGTASYDPATNTLTFNNAKLTTFSSHYVNKSYAAVQSKGIPLKIKGKLEISGGTSGESGDLYYGILMMDSGSKATLDADITIKNMKSAGIKGDNSDIEISGGRIEVEGSESVLAKGNITLGDDIKVISPEGAEFKTISGTTRLWISNSGTETVVKDGAVIGSDKPSYTVTFNLNGHGDAIEPVKVTEGNTVAAPTAPIAEGWIFGGWYTDEACTTAYDFTTPVTADITLYAKWTGVEYTVTFDMGGKATNIEQKVENGKTATRPENNPIAAGFKFMDWYKDAAFTTLFDFTSVITGDTTIYAKWVENTVVTYTVTFDANGVEAVNMPAVQNVEEGGTATKPVTDPSAEGYKFEGWYKEADGINEFDFTKAITENTVIFAKWTKIVSPDPEPGHSPLDPKPEIKEDTTQLWLVKGQKFIIGSDWKVADDKVSKKYVSISKKGQLKAKKVDGGAEVKIKNSVTGKELTLHISKPEIDKKLTLTIVSANTASSNQIKLTKDEHLDVLYYSAAPDVATVAQDGTVTAVAKGKAKITAYINGSAYNCTVNVKETVTPLERTIHVTKGASKPILKIQGVKKVDWKSASDDVAKVEKNKVKAGKAAGNTVITASANGLEYKINVFVEDPAVSMTETAGVAFETKSATKYEIMIPKGKEVTLSFASMDQPVVFKSTKPDIAFVDENGNVEARSKGKGKFTAKINGKTITITVKVTE